MNYSDVKILTPISSFSDAIFKEAVEIRLANNLLNRDKGFNLDKAWNPALGVLKSQRRREGVAAAEHVSISEHRSASATGGARV